MRNPPLTAEGTAVAIMHLLRKYEDETGKELSRFRISRNTLRYLSLRANLREDFVVQWIDETARWGWLAFPHGEEFALIHSSSTAGWVRIGAKRLADERNALLLEEDIERRKRLDGWRQASELHFTKKESTDD
jgi:hypothetical protein